MKTKVVNIYTDEYDVYIGRAGKGQDGFFGNPFNSNDRDKNIEDFRIYFLDRLKTDKEFKRRVLELKGKTLGCFCSPKPCHGDVIINYLNDNPVTINTLMMLINEQVRNGNLCYCEKQEETLKFIIKQLAYSWQNGEEIEILEMFKSSIGHR